MLKKTIAFILAFVMTTSSVFATAYDQAGIKKEIYDHLTQYETDFDVEYVGDTSGLKTLLNDSIESAISVDDYIYYLLSGYEVSYKYTSDKATIHMTMKYLSTAEREAALRTEVEKILLALQLEGLSDYQRIEKIANYMNRQYEYDQSLTKRDAYTLLTTKEGVCQAYAQLFYLLAKGAGVTVRNQSGELKGTPHLWNLVKVSDYWYHIDVTNLDLFKGAKTVIQSDNTLASLGYTWDSLVEPTMTSMFTVDEVYNSMAYDPAGIQTKLTPETLEYQMSAAAKAAEDRIDSFNSYKNILTQYFNNRPGDKSPALYQDALDTFTKLKAINLDGETVFNFENEFITLRNDNNEKVTNFINGNIAKATAMVSKNPNETTRKNALKYLEETKAYIPKMLFDTKSLAYYNKVLDARIKVHAQLLANYYVNQYKKTKKAAYKTAYTNLAKKYGIALK